MYELQADRLPSAIRAADNALTHVADYPAALLAKGRILLASGRPAESIDAFRRAAQLNPLPEYQWWLADALRAQHMDAEARATEEQLVDRGAASDPRTLSLYLATRRIDVPTAVALSDEELRARRDVFTLDAHAWALNAAGRAAEALPVIERAAATGTQDGRLFLHAGVIHANAGRGADARRWLRKARQLRVMLQPSEDDLLQTHLTRTRANQEK